MSDPATAANDTERIDPAVVDRIVARCGTGPEAAIPILQAIQGHFHYLPREALVRVCETTDISPAQVEGVATFYSQFRLLPVGRHLISVCVGTACHVAGARSITESIRRHLEIAEGEDTDDGGLFTVQEVACLGCCALAPVIRIDDRTYGRLTPASAPKALERFLREDCNAKRRGPPEEEAGAQAPQGVNVPEIRLGMGTCCIASGSLAVREAIAKTMADLGLNARLKLGTCAGMCHQDPLLEVVEPGRRPVSYGGVPPRAVRSILEAHIRPPGLAGRTRALVRRAADRLLHDAAWEAARGYAIDGEGGPAGNFLAKQRRIVLEGGGAMDPVDIDDYLAHGGYRALECCLGEMTPEEIIETVRRAGLRGRGGAGYPAWTKWAHVREQPGGEKYVVMNGDEGDPGAFMDRMLLESFPHRAIEGIAIAAYAIGAVEGHLYVRAEYPLAVERLRAAVAQAVERNYLGDRILGADFSLHLFIHEGAGAFVCGEETGLLASIEGRRGVPRYRPPYPAERGLRGRPTCVNNAETLGVVPWIIRHGAEAFAAIGTETSKGTKVFALAGNVKRGGLIEVPMGITIGEIVEDIGGGMIEGRRFKGVQIGGPSGGCIPASMRDVRIDYEEVKRTGAIMGSGGLVVLDDATCMVDIARYFLQFTQNESCGKCTFCRIGTRRMLEILERLCQGEGRAGDIERLEALAETIRKTSLCGLGQTAPNPVLTTIRYFRDEYEAHLEGRCPAGTCRALIRYEITDDCIGCTLCAQNCPADAIEMRPYERHEIDPEKCVRCGTCMSVCPTDAVRIVTGNGNERTTDH